MQFNVELSYLAEKQYLLDQCINWVKLFNVTTEDAEYREHLMKEYKIQ